MEAGSVPRDPPRAWHRAWAKATCSQLPQPLVSVSLLTQTASQLSTLSF